MKLEAGHPSRTLAAMLHFKIRFEIYSELEAKVSQAFSVPADNPVLNQVTRCSELP